MKIDEIIRELTDKLGRHESISLFIIDGGVDVYVNCADGIEIQVPDDLDFTDKMLWALRSLKENMIDKTKGERK